MLVDMSEMQRISLNTEKMSLTTGGGAIWNDVQNVLLGTNLSVVGGGCPSVGTVGLALGGGIGWLSRSRGLVSDNVVEMKVGSTLEAAEVGISHPAPLHHPESRSAFGQPHQKWP